MRVIVTGSRGYLDRKQVEMELDVTLMRRRSDQPMVVIHGGARGPDSWAGAWAKEHNLKSELFSADWQTHGKAAGMIRNRAMVEQGNPDLCLAFWDGNSRGTLDCLSRAVRAGILTHIVPPRRP